MLSKAWFIHMLIGCLVLSDLACAQEANSESPQSGEVIEQSKAIGVGQLSLAGTGCLQHANDQVTVTTGEIQIPARAAIKRNAGEGLKRGSCTFSLPLQMNAKERLVIKKATVDHLVNLSVGSKTMANLEIFFAGGQGPRLEFSDEALVHRKRARSTGEVETQLIIDCGGSATLRGNSSVIIQGGDLASSSRLDHLQLEYAIEACP